MTGGSKSCQPLPSSKEGKSFDQLGNECYKEEEEANYMDPDSVKMATPQASLNTLTNPLQVGSKESGSSSYMTPTQLANLEPYPGVE